MNENKNENENIISGILNAQKPGKDVLSAAKSVMEKNKPLRLRLRKRFYALASCSAVFIIAGAVFAVLYQFNIYPYAGGFSSNVESSSAVNGSQGWGYAFIIIAVSLILTGAALAIAAVIIKLKKINKDK